VFSFSYKSILLFSALLFLYSLWLEWCCFVEALAYFFFVFFLFWICCIPGIIL